MAVDHSGSESQSALRNTTLQYKARNEKSISSSQILYDKKDEQRQEENAARESRPITEAKRYIQAHFQEELKLEDVSAVAGFNTTYFSTLFKKETGRNFSDYLTELRVNKAKELLCEEGLSIQDVCEMVGYRDLKYFSRLFKKVTGISPSDHRKMYR